ncbi:glycoside hydrolase family 3 C-terminal domain-containing protein [Bifidobacterium sp. ESL0784]|uniref:glycoside hydrolase family 3 C-terminal domain-containing protein n=1 Tax=Bifidobacterium sp. ESL0784 TaxID=2983231 RepID=UPI0023F93F99|nr:glycoside hydrolase family 3 C-terminal domain-containing protein [Bifidobacterium sp. ESL0784]MDF7641529.1 glycoside hydrolase family 3 C-terminal domain-containing protein [Bifidobacterium sp. ESL0784]
MNTAKQFRLYCIIAVVVLGLVALACVATVVIRRFRPRHEGEVMVKSHASIWVRVLQVIAAVLAVVLAVVLNVETGQYKASINNVFQNIQKSNASVTTNAKDWTGLVHDIGEQGMVLMRNENGTLPLKAKKVNLLGYYAYNPMYSPLGSSHVQSSDAVSIEDSLESSGIQVNQALKKASVYPAPKPPKKVIGFVPATYSNAEVPIDKYQGEASFDKLQQYSDTSVVVLGRSGGEGNDLITYKSPDGHNYLQLSENEKNLLKEARAHSKKLIVVLNMSNAMETGFLNEFHVDACVWAGIPGPKGFGALGKIISGKVNPSGSLPDTWVYDNTSAPSYENYGIQAASNAPKSHYVDYVEGIYVGYKWYETAYAEKAVITSNKTGKTFDYGQHYDDIVAFPFGYGLSYTTFSQKIVDGLSNGVSLDPRGKLNVKVKVTNTGKRAGRNAVQLYMSAPYTDYDKTAGIEKSAVSLVGVAKSKILAAGESQTVTVPVSMQQIASWDSSHDNGDGTHGSYMFDKGQYVFSVRSDAHHPLDQVEAQMPETYFFSGKNKRDLDQKVAVNRFADVARGKYLSRNNGFANYTEAMKSVKSTVKTTAQEDNANDYPKSLDAKAHKMVKGKDYAKKGKLRLEDVAGLKYDDPKWNELLSQLTVPEMQSLVEDSLYRTPELPSIGKNYLTMDAEGPLGLSSMFSPDVTGISYPCVPLMAATFNPDLAAQFGSQMADQGHKCGVTGWFAPAMDNHRSPFSGRNGEYYSEDPMLSATMAGNVVRAASKKKMAVYIKHLALNDQESCRSQNLHTYANEQSIREIYLKPFETSVKVGHPLGVMTSMNFLGDVYVGSDSALQQDVLRGEWGFRGHSITDMDEAKLARGADAAMRAGTDSWLTFNKFNVSGDSDSDIYYLQRASHNILYTLANAERLPVTVLNWHLYVVIASVELAIIALALLCAVIVPMRRRAEKG